MSDENYAATFCDRADWGPGPWTEELDRYEWKSETGFQCLMVRHNRAGHWCGYIGVEHGHPWHGIEGTEARGADGDYVDVHGGITYSAHCHGRVCHIPKPGETEHLYWLGFDCAHCDDLRPGDEAYWRRRGESFYGSGALYRDADFVRHQTEKLARQALAVTNAP
jgi:hypothetical protein